MSGKPEEQYRPRLVWALRRGIGDYYDRLGLTALGSVALLAPVMIASAVGGILDHFLPRAVSTVMVLLVAWYGLCFMWAGNVLQAHRIAAFEEPGPDAFAEIFRKYGVGTLKLASAQLLITVIVLLDTLFFLRQGTWVMQIAGVVTAYILLLWGMMTLSQYPFLVSENRQTLKILRKSALVTLDNPFFTAGGLFVTMTLGALLVVCVVGIPLGLGGVLSCFSVRMHRECLKKYGMVEDEPEDPVDEGWPGSKGPPRRLNPRDLTLRGPSRIRSEDPSAFPNETDQSQWLR